MYLVVNTDDLIYALKPQYICMTGVDGVCTVNTFPVAYPRTLRPATKGYVLLVRSRVTPNINTTPRDTPYKEIAPRDTPYINTTPRDTPYMEIAPRDTSNANNTQVSS